MSNENKPKRNLNYEALRQQLATRINKQRIITGEAERLAMGPTLASIA